MTTIGTTRGFDVVLDAHQDTALLSLNDAETSRCQRLDRAQAAKLCEALSAFVDGAESGPEPADESKPTVEVIAELKETRALLAEANAWLQGWCCERGGMLGCRETNLCLACRLHGFLKSATQAIDA